MPDMIVAAQNFCHAIGGASLLQNQNHKAAGKLIHLQNHWPRCLLDREIALNANQFLFFEY
jgi:hypothetical protein